MYVTAVCPVILGPSGIFLHDFTRSQMVALKMCCFSLNMFIIELEHYVSVFHFMKLCEFKQPCRKFTFYNLNTFLMISAFVKKKKKKIYFLTLFYIKT